MIETFFDCDGRPCPPPNGSRSDASIGLVVRVETMTLAELKARYAEFAGDAKSPAAPA